jgi:hypothetical protein
MTSSVKILEEEQNSFGTVKMLTFRFFGLYRLVNVVQKDNVSMKYFSGVGSFAVDSYDC